MTSTRRWPRLSLAIEVTVRLDSVADVRQARTLNVSREGLFVAMDPAPPVGSRLRVQLVIGHEQHAVEGLVVRTVPDPDEPHTASLTPGVGVFLTMTDAGWEKLLDRLIAAEGGT